VLSAYGGLVSWLGTGARGLFYRDAESQNSMRIKAITQKSGAHHSRQEAWGHRREADSDEPDPCQPTGYPNAQKPGTGNQRKSVLQRARQ
jgi:hypothetical protein